MLPGAFYAPRQYILACAILLKRTLATEGIKSFADVTIWWVLGQDSTQARWGLSLYFNSLLRPWLPRQLLEPTLPAGRGIELSGSLKLTSI